MSTHPHIQNSKTPKIPNSQLIPISHFFFPFTLANISGCGPQELANQSQALADGEANKGLVVALYDALSSRDVDAVSRLLAPDLEWWFHGPPSHQFLKHILTGSESADDDDSSQPFAFVPQSISPFGSVVLAEGCDASRSISWVHAWTVSDGIISQVREYFNTSVTVTRLGNGTAEIIRSGTGSGSGSGPRQHHHHCQPVWESRLSNRVGKSVPGLVLAL